MTDPRITEITAQLAQSDRAFNALKESHAAQDIAHIELKARLATAEKQIADAWDEGHDAGHEDFIGNDGTWPTTPNPYRTPTKNGDTE